MFIFCPIIIILGFMNQGGFLFVFSVHYVFLLGGFHWFFFFFLLHLYNYSNYEHTWPTFGTKLRIVRSQDIINENTRDELYFDPFIICTLKTPDIPLSFLFIGQFTIALWMKYRVFMWNNIKYGITRQFSYSFIFTKFSSESNSLK